MLNYCSTVHNTMLLEFRKAAAAGGSGGSGGLRMDASDGGGLSDPVEATAGAPIVNYLTNSRVVAQKLLVYDRAASLFPVLLAHSDDDGGRGYVCSSCVAQLMHEHTTPH